MKRAALLFVVLAARACAASVVTDTAWDADNFPNPTTSPELCGRAGATMSWICDPDELLTMAERDHIEQQLKDIYEDRTRYPATSCKGVMSEGNQVAVAIMRHISGPASNEAKAELMARQLHDKWGVGDGCGSGVLMLFATGDRQMFFTTGKSARKRVSDNTLDLIQDRLKPHLRAGRYGDAISSGVKDMGEALAGRISAPSAFPIFAAVVAGLALWAFVSSRLEARRRASYQDCRRKLSKLEEDVAKARAAQYRATSCPICMEDFPAQPQEGAEGGAGGAGSSGAGTSAAAAAQGGAEGPSASDADGAPAVAGTAGEPELLRCGHTFCKPCLDHWLKSHSSCPICRADAATGKPAGAQPPPPPNDSQQQHFAHMPAFGSPNVGFAARGPGAGWSAFEREYAFRVNRIHRLHPMIVPRTLADEWINQGPSASSFTTSPEILAADPVAQAAQAAAARSRAGGSGSGAKTSASRGFGGGSSSGGGGRGSSW